MVLSRCVQNANEECIEAENSSEVSEGEVWDRVLQCRRDRESNVRCPACEGAGFIGRKVFVVRCGCDQDVDL